MKKKISGIWYLIGFLLIIQVVASVVLWGTPLTTALLQVLAIGAVAFFAVWLWRILRLSRVFVWMYWRTPLSKLPKTTVVILLALSFVVGFFFITLTVIYKFDQPPPEPYVLLDDFIKKAEKKQIGEHVVEKRFLKIMGLRNVVFFMDSADGQKKWTYFDNAPPSIPPISPDWWLIQRGYHVTQMDSFPWSFSLTQLMAGLMVSIPFFFFMWLVGGGGMRSTFQEWGTIKQARMRRHPPVYFKEIGGLENAIKLADDLVAFLKNPSSAKSFGARMPTGVLLSGPTGSGKTMFATAIATESGVPFFHMSGSDFRKPLVGLGSDAIKHLFDLGRRNAPCIIFIDEFDSAVPVRGSGGPLSGNEGDAITNTMLSEVDDINKNGLAILVIGATNLLSKVDDAAKRPGRFDRSLIIQYPDEKGRAKILTKQLSTEPSPFGLSVVNNDNPENPTEELSAVPEGFVKDLANELAKITPGFSGAALNTLNNEARVIAWRKKRYGLRKDTFIAREDFYEALPSALTRSQKSDRVRDERELDLVAWHESGHTYFSYLCKGAEPTGFTFLEPHGEVGGMAVHGGDNHIPTRTQMLAGIWVTLAGYVVEKAHFGEVSTGPSSDLKNLTLRVRAMTHDWGMGEQGPIAIDVLEGQAEDNTYARIRGPISHKAQKEAQTIIVSVETAMLKLLEDRGEGSHHAKIGKLAAALREKHMLREAEIKEIIGDIEQIEVTA
jgi:cell division protease FtsH